MKRMYFFVVTMSIFMSSVSISFSDDQFLYLSGSHPLSQQVIDLKTVKVIGPDKYEAKEISIKSKEGTKLLLIAFEEMFGLCKKGEGSYPPTEKMLGIGVPDQKVESVRVSRSDAVWPVPYSKFNMFGKPYEINIGCFINDDDGTRWPETKSKNFLRQLILKEFEELKAYDCRRGLVGFYYGYPTETLHWRPVESGTFGEDHLESFCAAVNSSKK